MIRNIFFDFDGVLVESVNVKTKAFEDLYSFAGKEISAKVVEYHLANGGISRFDKIRYFHKQFLGITLTESEILQWADRFSELALTGVINASEVEGAVSFLDQYHHTYRCWVITGTPTTEIKTIIAAKGWESYFEGIYGSPEKKRHWTEFLIATEQLKREETIFVGDATTDMDAAQFSGLHFCLRKNKENAHLFADYKGHEIADINGLDTIIQKINESI